MKEHQVEFYFQLGLLATLFAKLEEKVRWMLVILIDDHQPTVGLYVIERNSLAENLDLLQKINDLRHYYPNEINELIKKIQPLRTTRNAFIHGVWGDPVTKEGQVYIEVSKNKVRRVEDEVGTSWFPSTKETYTLDSIKERIEVIKVLNHDLHQWAVQFYIEKQARIDATRNENK